MDILRPHTVTWREACGRLCRAAERTARQHAVDVSGGELALVKRFAVTHCMAGRYLIGIDQLTLEQHVLEAKEPFFVIGTGEVDGGRQHLARVARLVDIP